MIIYGYRETHLGVDSTNTRCECDQANYSCHIFQRYAHIFWIPIIPLKKRTVLKCSKCGFAISENHAAGKLLGAMKAAKSMHRTPLWCFAGGLAILLFLSITHYVAERNQQHLSSDLSHPSIGDVLIVPAHQQTASGPHDYWIPMKIVRVQPDILTLIPGGYQFASSHAVQEALRKGARLKPGFFITEKPFEVANQLERLKVPFIVKAETL